MTKPTFKEACAKYVHRFTMEHKPVWAQNPSLHGKYYAPQFRTDREWYDNTEFPPHPLCYDEHSCYTCNQTWPLGTWLNEPFEINRQSQRFFAKRLWIDKPEKYHYLGSERNPWTSQPYDFYAVRTGTGKEGWSFTSRHGMGDGDYGSGDIGMCYHDHLQARMFKRVGSDDGYVDLATLRADHVWGLHRAEQLTLFYLATGRKPLCEKR